MGFPLPLILLLPFLCTFPVWIQVPCMQVVRWTHGSCWCLVWRYLLFPYLSWTHQVWEVLHFCFGQGQWCQWDDSHHRLVHLSEYRPFLGAGVDLLMVSMNLQVSTCMLTPNPSDCRTVELRSLFCTLQEQKLCLLFSSSHWLGLSH